MLIEQEKEFKPLVITIQTREEYDVFFSIINEAIDKRVKVFMDGKGKVMCNQFKMIYQRDK